MVIEEMNSCDWERIESFNGWAEFDRFKTWMAGEVENGDAAPCPVAQSYQNLDAFKEEWFEHVASKQVWRLVWPDPPFSGLFEKVDGQVGLVRTGQESDISPSRLDN